MKRADGAAKSRLRHRVGAGAAVAVVALALGACSAHLNAYEQGKNCVQVQRVDGGLNAQRHALGTYCKVNIGKVSR